MAARIQGITIKLKGDTTELQNSLNQVDKASKDLNKELKQINTSLKFHPGNSDLIAQKQRVLAESVENTKKKLDDLKRAQEQTSKEMAAGDSGKQSQYDALTREIKKTEDQLKSMSRELAATSSKASQFGEAMQRAGDKMQETGGKIKGVGDDLTTKVTLPLAAVGAAGFAMAADLQDAMGATDQIFKSAAGEMKNWASSLESFYGIAEGEALQYANTMGAMLQNIGGLSEAEAAKQAQILTELAGDLSAMFGGTTESAIQALTGALKGNNSMLDNYGMGVNEATIKTKAMEMGLIAEGEQLDLAGKQAATLALIMEQTADAQGQAGREAEGASGTMKAFATEAKNLATEIGNVLLPIITPLINKAKEFVAGFKSMDSGTKELIVKIGLFAAAIGPVLVVLGTLITSVGTVTGAIGGVITAFSAGGAAAAALRAPLTGLLGPLGLVIAGVAAVGVAAWNLAQDAIPAVDLFGEGVSDATATAVGAFLELEEGATTALNQMVWSGQEVTEQYKETIGGAFTQMKDTILNSLVEQKEQSATTLQEMFANNAQLSEEEKQRMLAALDEELTSKESKIAEGEARVQEILALASEEKRALTQAEKDDINRIQEEMRTVAVQTLSESEAEQLAIMESLKANAGTLSAQQAAEVVQNSVKQKDEAIAAANEEYNERLKAAALLRADGTKESADMADAIVKEATRQRDEAVKQAEGMHADVVAEAKAQAGEHVNEVDWSTGEIKSKWQVMKEDVTAKAKALGEQVSSDFETMKTNASRKVEELKTKATEAFEGIRKGAEEKIDAAKTAITDGIEVARQAVADYVDRFKSVGRDIIDGIASGIRNGIDAVTSAARNVAERALTAAKNFLGIRSPSRKMRDEVGAMVSEGLAIGIKSKTYEVEQASKGIAETSMEAVKKNLHPKTFEQSLDGIIHHLLSTEKEFLKFYDTFGLGGEEMFERLRQGGKVAMTEVIDLINFMGGEGYDAAEIGKYMGDNWHDAMALIIDKYTEWDMANQRTVYSIDEMNKSFAAMLGGVGKAGKSIASSITKGTKDVTKAMGGMAGDAMDAMMGGIDANLPRVQDAMEGIANHILKNKKPIEQAFEEMGYSVEETFANLKAGGTAAMEEVIGVMASLQDNGFQSSEMAAILGANWSEALQLIVWNMTGWDTQTQKTTYNLDEMNRSFAAMLGVGQAGTQAVEADLENLGATAEAVAKQSERAIMQHLETLHSYVSGNKQAFIAAMDSIGYFGDDVWNNIAHGGSDANGVIAAVIKHLNGITDEAQRSAVGAAAFGNHWKSALNGMIEDVGMWESEYNVGSWAIDQNKLLSVSLEEVEAAAKKVRESIKAENFAEPIKDDSIKNVKEKMKVELTEIEDFTKQTLDGVKKQFDETFADIQKSVVSNLKDKVVPALKDSLKSGLDVVYGFTQDVFDDFEHVFYELRDVVVVNLREHVTPGMRNQLQQMLQIMSGSSQTFYDTGQLWMRALADGIRSGMINVQSALQAIPAGQVTAGGTGVQWYDSGGIFRSPTIIGVGEKRPEFVGALDDLKTIVADVIDRKGTGGGEVLITGNTFVVRTEDDIRRVAEELKRLQDRERRGGR